MGASVVWFRQDLRLQDNEALLAACRRGAPIIPLYILDDAGEGGWPLGKAARGWLRASLESLATTLRARGSRLILRQGDSRHELLDVCHAAAADVVYWTRRYEPHARRRDEALATALRTAGIRAVESSGSLLFEPEAIRNRQGGPFQVFGPFWRTCLAQTPRAEVALPPGPLPAPRQWPAGARLDVVAPATSGLHHVPMEPGESAAHRRLEAFVGERMADYAVERDLPAVDGTSRLSAPLHFGELSPRQIWAAVERAAQDSGVFPPNKGATVFLTELGWREFAYHLLVAFPHTPDAPLRPAFAHFPWASDPGGERLRAWQHGETGYPIVDAGMRQLRETGWMHNRVRMIVASFLVKHLRLSWTEGAAWFWEHLVDADLANNTLGWQWSAGCGADAAPYFRIFAPVTQGQKFDRAGDYVRRWVPELAALPTAVLHAPWTAPEALASAGIVLGRHYPRPIVDHATARREALEAFQRLKR